MHQILDTAPDVLAVQISGRIEAADLDMVISRMEQMLARPGKIHVFAETRAIDGIAVDGFADYARRAAPLLGKLQRFGRVAVVADQRWVRWGARLESAILPGISYRVFEPHERDIAFRWVTTGEDRA